MQGSGDLPVLRGDGDGGATEGVVEPSVLGVGRGEEAFEVQRGGDARDEGVGTVEEGEEAVPIDREKKGMVGGEEGSASGKRDGATAEAGDWEGDDRIGLREFGDEDELVRLSRCEGLKEVCLQEGFEAAFDGHPDGLGLKEGLECIAGGEVGEVVRQRADGGQERLIDARAGGEPGVRRYVGPRALCRLCEDLRVGGVLVGDAPGERGGDANERMQNDKDRFKEAAIGLEQRDAVRGVSKAALILRRIRQESARARCYWSGWLVCADACAERAANAAARCFSHHLISHTNIAMARIPSNTRVAMSTHRY